MYDRWPQIRLLFRLNRLHEVKTFAHSYELSVITTQFHNHHRCQALERTRDFIGVMMREIVEYARKDGEIERWDKHHYFDEGTYICDYG